MMHDSLLNLHSVFLDTLYIKNKFRKICENFMQVWVVCGMLYCIFTTKIILKIEFSSAEGFLKTTIKIACAQKWKA